MMVMRMWHMNIPRAVRQVVAGLVLFLLAASPALAQNTLSTLLPDGKQQFLDNTGNPLASGKVFMYVPNTTTFKNTWQDSGQVTLNTNPIILDAGGRAIIYGTGIYRQLVQTSASVTIYDALTSATNVATVLTFVGGTSTNSANVQAVITVETAGFLLANKPTVYFNPGFTNTGSMTLNVNSSGARNVLKPSFSGPVALTGGEVRTGQLASVTYDGTQWILAVDTPYLGISTSLSSAGTTDLGTVASHVVQVTGTTTITAFGSTASVDFPVYLLRFSGILTLTHNGTSLILPGAANITTAANDTATAQYLGSGNWQITQYQRAVTTLYNTTLPTVTRLITGGPLTYTSPTGVVRHRVRMAGGGGGGGAAILNVAATSGTASSFKVNADAAAWTAAGGAFGAAAGGAGGAGGTGGTTGTTGTLINRSDGTAGGESPSAAGLVPGGNGGSNEFGGGGVGIRGSTGGTGTSGKTNTGGGGAGGGQNGAVSGSGGGGGEYVEFWVTGMTSALYTVGAGGVGGTAGTVAGNAGAAGIIIVEEFYQ